MLMFKLRRLNLSTVDVWSQIIFCRGHPLSMEVFEARIRTLLIYIISLFCGCSDCRILPSRRDVEQHPCPSFATSSSIPPTKDVSGHCAVTPRVGTTLCDKPCDGRGCWSIPCARPTLTPPATPSFSASFINVIHSLRKKRLEGGSV